MRNKLQSRLQNDMRNPRKHISMETRGSTKMQICTGMQGSGLHRKSQIISTDLIYGLIAFILIVSIFVGIFMYSRMSKGAPDYEYELDYLFLNIEKNVEQMDESVIFIDGSRVDYVKLERFYQASQGKSIDDIVIEQVGNATGVGLDEGSYDTCLFFTDDEGRIEVGGITYVGKIRENTCEQLMTHSYANPCDSFKSAVSLFKPVLLDTHDYSSSRIIQMNLVVCKV